MQEKSQPNDIAEEEDNGRGPPPGSDSGSDTEGEGSEYDSDATEGGELARRLSTIAVTSKRDRNESKEERRRARRH